MPRQSVESVRRTRKKGLPAVKAKERVERRMQIEEEPVSSLPATAPVEVPAPSDPLRWLWYLLSLFVPFVGVVIALFLADHEARAQRLVGRNCLLVSFIVWILLPMVLFFLLALLAGVALLDVLGNAFPPA